MITIPRLAFGSLGMTTLYRDDHDSSTRLRLARNDNSLPGMITIPRLAFGSLGMTTLYRDDGDSSTVAAPRPPLGMTFAEQGSPYMRRLLSLALLTSAG